MTKRITGPLIAAVLVVAAIALAGIAVFNRAQAQGQQPPAVRIQVVVIQLKPDMMTTWEDLQKNEMIPAQKKAGLPWRHTLANGKVRKMFADGGMDLFPPERETPEAAAALLKSEIKLWGDVIRANNISAQ